MDFSFSQEEEAFRSMVRDWVDDEVPQGRTRSRSSARRITTARTSPSSCGRTWPRRASSGSASTRSSAARAATARSSRSSWRRSPARSRGIAWIWGVNQFNTKSIQRFASESLKQKLIPQLVGGQGQDGDRRDRARRRHRPARRDDHDGHPGRGRLADQRRQDLVDDGARLRLPAPARHERPERREGVAREDALPRRREAGRRRLAPDPEARHALRRLLRGAARQRLRPLDARDRRGQQGLGPHPLDAQQRAHPRRGHVHRHPPRRDRGGGRLRERSARPSARRSASSR